MANEINMARWIVALRSGKYTQARGRLRDNAGGMCCLGVLCDISALGEWRKGMDGNEYVVNRDGGMEVPPIPVARWLFSNSAVVSRSEINPSIKDPATDDYYECAQANDDSGWGFGEIANALEYTYLPGKKAEEILAGAE